MKRTILLVVILSVIILSLGCNKQVDKNTGKDVVMDQKTNASDQEIIGESGSPDTPVEESDGTGSVPAAVSSANGDGSHNLIVGETKSFIILDSNYNVSLSGIGYYSPGNPAQAVFKVCEAGKNYGGKFINVYIGETKTEPVSGTIITVHSIVPEKSVFITVESGDKTIAGATPLVEQTTCDCDDGHVFTKDKCSGGKCIYVLIEECVDNDDYCPSMPGIADCDYTEDNDCPSEDECESSADCDDNDSATVDSCGFKIPKKCKHMPTTQCKEDNYCPINCKPEQDPDC